MNEVPPGMPTWWSRLFLPSFALDPPGCGGAKKKKKASINILCGYARFSIILGIWNGDPEIHLHKYKGNQTFFLTFHCTYILRKETDLECRERRVCLVCRERRFCAIEGNFAMKGDLQILSIVKEKNCDFFVSLKNTEYNRKVRKRNLTSHEIVGTHSDRWSRVMYGLRHRPSNENTWCFWFTWPGLDLKFLEDKDQGKVLYQ